MTDLNVLGIWLVRSALGAVIILGGAAICGIAVRVFLMIAGGS